MTDCGSYAPSKATFLSSAYSNLSPAAHRLDDAICSAPLKQATIHQRAAAA